MGKKVRICGKNDVPEGHGRKFEVGTKEIAVFNINGEFHALDAVCVSGRAELVEGAMTERGDLLCPLHGWRFDIVDGACAMRPNSPVATYDLEIDGDDILAEI